MALDVRSAVPSLLEALELRDHRCVVVGAAPLGADGFGPPDLDERIVAVNGGISSVPAGWAVDVWAVNAHVTMPSAMTRLMYQQATGRYVRLLMLILREERAEAATLGYFRRRDLRFEEYVSIAATDRDVIERESGARTGHMTKHALSAGFFTVCACLMAGASAVRMVGFSWEPGYAYVTLGTMSRGHEHGDRMALTRLQARYGPRVQTTLRAQEA